MERHGDGFTQGDERSAAFDQSVNLALLWCGWNPGVQLGVFVGDHPGDEFGIHTIGLAPQSNGLGIVVGILGIQQEDQKAELVGSVSEQLVMGTGGFHADAAARRQTLEKGQRCGALISDLARGEAPFRTGHHDRVLGNIGADIEHCGWGLHDVPPLTKLNGAGVEHTCVSLRSNRRS